MVSTLQVKCVHYFIFNLMREWDYHPYMDRLKNLSCEFPVTIGHHKLVFQFIPNKLLSISFMNLEISNQVFIIFPLNSKTTLYSKH